MWLVCAILSAVFAAATDFQRAVWAALRKIPRGGARTYVEALKPFGLNPRDPAFWSVGCRRLERLIDQFEALG